MKVTNVENKEKSTVELTIQVPAEEFEAAVQASYLKQRANINVPGFRKGKAPRKIIESMYGAKVFYEEAINAVYPKAYEDAVAEQNLDDVGYPNIEVLTADAEGLTFKAIVAVRPEVKLGTYKGISAYREEPKISAKDVDAEMKPFIERATTLVSVKRKAKKNDTAVIDFEGFDDGVAFEGGKGENYELKLGSGSFVPGFEEQIIGMKAGEEKDLDITFPENYHPELAGKAVVFHVKVNEVKEPQAPELDDEFAKDVSEFETMDEFRKDLEEKLMERRKAEAQNAFENSVLEQLVDGMECEIPDAMVDVAADRMLDEYAMRLQQQGISMDDYMKMTGMTAAAMRIQIRPQATRQLQVELALNAVAKAENLEVSAEEYDAEYNKLAEQYKLDVEQIKKVIAVDILQKDLLLNKANELVMNAAKATKTKRKPAAKKAAAEAEEPKAE